MSVSPLKSDSFKFPACVLKIIALFCASKNSSAAFIVLALALLYFPSLINYLNDYLIVVGGKNQIQCECYQLSNTKWKQLPTLPDDRYKATLFCDEQNDNIYLFGGYNSSGKCNSKSILRLNMKTCSIWELIVVKENENFLARNSSICFMFEGTDKIFICGGKDNNDKDTEYIIE